MPNSEGRNGTDKKRRVSRAGAKVVSRRSVITAGAAVAAGAVGAVALSTSSAEAQEIRGILLRSPDGTRYRVTVDNSGNLVTSDFSGNEDEDEDEDDE